MKYELLMLLVSAFATYVPEYPRNYVPKYRKSYQSHSNYQEFTEIIDPVDKYTEKAKHYVPEYPKHYKQVFKKNLQSMNEIHYFHLDPFQFTVLVENHRNS